MNILTNRIEYAVGDALHQGYLAYDDEIADARPAIMIVHEWWGLNDYIIRRAHMLAELGYVALAIDMYGGGAVALDTDQAGALMTGVLNDMETGTAALEAGYDLLLSQPGVDPERTAAIGYCFGGAMVLHMARIGLPLSAVASFHGALGSFHTAEPGSIKPHVLVCHGKDCRKRMDCKLVKRLRKNAAKHCPDQPIRVTKADCLGKCDDGPVVALHPDTKWFGRVDRHTARAIVKRWLRRGKPVFALGALWLNKK